MQAIVARYTCDDKEYSVVVTGHGKEMNGTAPDIVAARALADKLVKKIATEPSNEPIVVHLLDNSAVEFTGAYLNATLFTHPAGQGTDAGKAGNASTRDHRESSKRTPEPADTTRTTPSRKAASEDEQETGTKSSTADDKGVSAP